MRAAELLIGSGVLGAVSLDSESFSILGVVSELDEAFDDALQGIRCPHFSL